MTSWLRRLIAHHVVAPDPHAPRAIHRRPSRMRHVAGRTDREIVEFLLAEITVNHPLPRGAW